MLSDSMKQELRGLLRAGTSSDAILQQVGSVLGARGREIVNLGLADVGRGRIAVGDQGIVPPLSEVVRNEETSGSTPEDRRKRKMLEEMGRRKDFTYSDYKRWVQEFNHGGEAA